MLETASMRCDCDCVQVTTAPEAPEKTRPGLWQRFLDRFAPEVPDAIAFCEFECRKASCDGRHWETCKRRLGTRP